MNSTPSIRWLVALRAEAKEIISQYELKSFEHQGPYQIFKSKKYDIWLIISGIGKVNAAAASAYLFLKSKATPWSIWINFGIAGFEKNYGTIFKIDKIISQSNNKTFFPSKVIKDKIEYASLLTVDRAQENYSENYMYDMEGSGFFETTSKIASHDLILVLKIVSDNSKNKVTNINKDNIDCLVKKNILAVKNCLKNLIDLSEEIYISKQKPKSFYELTSKYSFTFSQKIVLEDLLKKWQLLFPKRKLDVIINDCKDSKSVIFKLKSKIDETAISWS